jgi:leucyl/phenylalanyl-tRNA---protein transferase
MAESASDPELFWVDPTERGIFPLDGIKVSRSLRKVVRNDRFMITFDRDFDGVISNCATAGPGRNQTWINGTIRTTYGTLFQRGFVHTVEAWYGSTLVGGLYGLAINGAFFGESMFHRASDASKVCLVHLAAALVSNGFTLLDAQFITPHLATLGAIEISRDAYHVRLSEALKNPARFPQAPANPAAPGETALAILDQAQDYLPAGSLPPNSLP